MYDKDDKDIPEVGITADAVNDPFGLAPYGLTTVALAVVQSESIVEGLTTIIGGSVVSFTAAPSAVVQVAPLFAILGFYKAVTIASPPGTKADCDMVKAALRAGKQEIQNSASTRHDGISGHVTR